MNHEKPIKVTFLTMYVFIVMNIKKTGVSNKLLNKNNPK